MQDIRSTPSITHEFIEKHISKPWYWGKFGLSINPSITHEFVEKHSSKNWCWGEMGLSSNTFETANKKLKEKREKAARIIQNGCYNWIFSPKCKDGTVGIFPRISWNKLESEINQT